MFFTMPRRLPLSLVVLVATYSSAHALTLLPPGHTWEYTFTDPTGDPTWNTTTGVGGIWALGAAPFGNATGLDPDFDFVTLWEVDEGGGDDLWVRTTLDLTGADLSTVAWNLGADNGFTLYANGVVVGSLNDEGYTFRWEYSGGFGGSLIAGPNVLAVALEDHGGFTAFDMQVTGVPEPATTALLATQFIVFVGSMRKRRRGTQ